MSFEMDCVKHSVLGGHMEDLPTDLQFILERDYSNVLDFLNDIWNNSGPCYFVWCVPKQLERIFEIDSESAPLQVLKNEGGNLLLKVSNWTYSHLRVSERKSINGETGWVIKHVLKESVK